MNLRIQSTAYLLALASICGTEAIGNDKSDRETDIVRIGGVAYKPNKVTIFRNLTTYLNRQSFPADFVLYSDYDKLNDALDRGDVDIAWNGPGHHAKFHVRNGGSQSLGMRDVDQDRVTLVVREDSNIKSPKDLAGKRLILGDSGNQQGAPDHFLKKEGVDFGKLKLVRLDSSANGATDVLKALSEGQSDAAVILESAWKRSQQFRRANPAIQAVWNSPEICHCTFTAAQEFDATLGSRFTQIITNMDPEDPLVAELNRLEGAQKWLPGNPKGFEVLVNSLTADDASANKPHQETAPKKGQKMRPKDVVRIGGFARAPKHVTVFKNLTTYLNRKGFKSDFVLYSSYLSVIDALDRGEVDIAWQSPVPHAIYHLRAGGSQALAMRNVDAGLRVTLVVRDDSKIRSVTDLAGRRLILGSSHNAEGALLPVHYLKKQGVNLETLKIVSLDKEKGPDGKRANTSMHVLKALSEGRGDAAVVLEQVWKNAKTFRKENPGITPIWTSPEFCHCTFTAPKDFDAKLGSQFTRIVTNMDPMDPLIAELNRLEHTQNWVPSQSKGYEALYEALKNKEKLLNGASKK